jgi:hypothetical protein
MSGPWLIPLDGGEGEDDGSRIPGSFTLEARAELGTIAKQALKESGATAVGDLLSYEEHLEVR